MYIYQWQCFVDRDVVFIESEYAVNFAAIDLNKKPLIDVTRLMKHFGFSILYRINSSLVPYTVNLNEVYKLVDVCDKVICKPVTGARSIGLIIGSPGLIAELVTVGDFKDQTVETIKDYFPKEVQLINWKDKYLKSIYEWLENYYYIAQPFYENVKAEYRLYVSAYNNNEPMFRYIVKRETNYFEARNKQDKEFQLLKLDDFGNKDVLDEIAQLIMKFTHWVGRRWPSLSIDLLELDNDSYKVIDYGIEYAIPYIMRDKNAFRDFKTWINQCVDQVLGVCNASNS